MHRDHRQLTANAFEKCGVHALQKACFLLGVNAKLGHLPFAEHDGRMIVCFRDPRDALVGAIRDRGMPVTQGVFLSLLRDFNGSSFVAQAMAYAPWLSSGRLCVRYEELIANDSVIRCIAEYLDVPFLDDAFENLPGHTATWRLPHSDFRSIWTPVVEAAWRHEGGQELLEAWAYG